MISQTSATCCQENGVNRRFSNLPRMGSGRVSDARRYAYEREVGEVVAWMRDYVSGLGFAPVARSWLYAFESERIITKGDFDMASRWLADNRKNGLIPFDLVGADVSRAMEGEDVHDEEATPQEYVNRLLRNALEEGENYWPASYWKQQHCFPIVWTEKRDLIRLFEPELPQAIKRFAGKGWADINSRVEVVRWCQWAERHNLLPVILYCGDHDPAGLQISESICDNLQEIAAVMGWTKGLASMKRNGRIVRFGLSADFIDAAGLLWIDGLETSSGEDLANPRHKQHDRPYVQNYLAQYGGRKCEANALIANPKAARNLMSCTLWEWLSRHGHDQWQSENKRASDEAAAAVDHARRLLALLDSVGALYSPRAIAAGKAVAQAFGALPPGSIEASS